MLFRSSEDWTFCENWRDLGGRVWVDKRVLLRHSGSYVFCMENQQYLLDNIGPMYVEAQQAKAAAATSGAKVNTAPATKQPAKKAATKKTK